MPMEIVGWFVIFSVTAFLCLLAYVDKKNQSEEKSGDQN